MTKKLILHIPHASTRIPFMDGYVADEKSLEKEMLKLTDWHTDDLFDSTDDEVIRADFSRIFCDAERFTDDEQEVMSKFGMGVLYEKTDDGQLMRNVSQALRKKILPEFYCKHHAQFNEAVNNQLNHFGKALIIDCHSYPSIPLHRDLDQTPNRPDFNIGTDTFHTPPHLVKLAESFFENTGYTLGVDKPYSGAIVPLEHYHKNKNVQSIMLEINRALYLNEPGNEKSSNYAKIKMVTQEFMRVMKGSL
jgi:N-formylglutamate amidohydrolase